VVNEPEGTVLGFIARNEPVTRYQILRAFRRSPLTIQNTSKGSVYPLVRRMVARGLVVTERRGDTEEAEVLTLTPNGVEALRLWVRAVGPQYMLLRDPIKMRVLSIGELSRDERIRWIAKTKGLLLAKKEEFEAYNLQVQLPYSELIVASYMRELDNKLEFLDRLLIKVVQEDEAEKSASYHWSDESADETG